MATISVAARLGMRVPDELSVIGYDDVPFAGLVDPPLTTVRAFPRKLGVEAARLLVSRLEHGPRANRHVSVTPELVVRRSTGPAPA